MTNMIKIGLLFRVNHLICIYNLQVLSNNNCLASSYTFKDRYSEFHQVHFLIIIMYLQRR